MAVKGYIHNEDVQLLHRAYRQLKQEVKKMPSENPQTFKVVGISNFNLDYVSDILICDSCYEYDAKRIADYFNTTYGPRHTYYFVVKPENYILNLREP